MRSGNFYLQTLARPAWFATVRPQTLCPLTGECLSAKALYSAAGIFFFDFELKQKRLMTVPDPRPA